MILFMFGSKMQEKRKTHFFRKRYSVYCASIDVEMLLLCTGLASSLLLSVMFDAPVTTVRLSYVLSRPSVAPKNVVCSTPPAVFNSQSETLHQCYKHIDNVNRFYAQKECI